MYEDPLAASWLAAVLDCEGTITIKRLNRRNSNRANPEIPGHEALVLVTNTDMRLLERAKALTGCGKFSGYPHPKNNPNWKRCYTWSASASNAARVLRAVRPYLVLKLEQCDAALALQDTKKWSGFRTLPLDVLQERERLTQCVRDLNRRGLVVS